MIRNQLKLVILFLLFQSCSSIDYLSITTSNRTAVDDDKLIVFQYEESYHTLGHNYEPWETTNYTGEGNCYININTFLKEDTLTNSRGKEYTSFTDFRNNDLLFLDYGDVNLLELTQDLVYEKIIETARYSPTIIVYYLIENKEQTKLEYNEDKAIYSLDFGKNRISIFIDKSNLRIDKITCLNYHELYGDIITTYRYSVFKSNDNVTYPSQIIIEKINGKVIDTVTIVEAKVIPNTIELLQKPDDYKLKENEVIVIPDLEVTAYNNFIHFIDILHTEDRILVVEFEDYMLVAEAPLNSANGELIIAEVRKIAPGKEIKYFVFGHHHPHYLGGLRAFVHKEATVLCTDVSKDYVGYIAKASHSFQPDSLELEPKILKTQIIHDSLVLDNGKMMKIYSIGDKSAHTKDYLLYYFPNQKMLFQDDLCWIPKEGEVTKAGSRQIGLYNSIIDLNLDVETIVQSWPVSSHKVKTVIPFSDLEKSINLVE